MSVDGAICQGTVGVHTEDDPVTEEKNQRSDVPTKDDQLYRISGTTSGGAIFGGALASVIGSGVIIGAIVGGLVGFGIATLAASHALSRRA
jgi:hypothetical protein